MSALRQNRAGRLAARIRAAAAITAAALLLAGCASLNLEQTVSLPDPPKQTEPPSPAQREHARILAAYGGAYQEPRLEGLIKETLDKLVAASGRTDLRYRVTILNSPAINAFALPTGHLYVTRGMLALANDTSELASVLAHEMAHVTARHAAIREDQARQAAIVSRVVSDVISDPQTGALALARSKIALASFSRSQELEADAIGIGIAARAGFDPYGAQRFLTSMGRNAGLKPAAMSGSDPRSIDFLSSHPSTPDRVKNAMANARQHAAPGTGIRDRKAYVTATDGMTYGEDPNEGFVRGRRFLHPKLGFTFVAPEGFTLDNTAQAVLGIKDNGSQALRLDIVRIPSDQNLGEYLTSGWIERVDAKSVEELNINGLPAATAVARGEQWSFRLYAVRFGTDVYRFVFASKQKSPEADRVFREAVGSFRRLTVEEIDRARPLRIKTVIVEPGDTVELLGARMATDMPVDRFLVLNGFEPGTKLTPGEAAKVVVE